MGVRGKKIAVQDLRMGMFVSDLDRPWHETPFPIQGFVIRKQEQLDQLNRYCRTVSVDVAEVKTQKKTDKPRNFKSGSNVLKLPAIQIRNPRTYTVSESLSEGINHADNVLEDLSGSLDYAMDSLRAGRLPSFARIEAGVRQMCDSIIRNPDALLWLSRVKHRDQYSYQHSLNATIWSLVLGRHMGLEPDVLEHLGMGTMLCHIGKSRVPKQLLVDESRLSGEDRARYQRYVIMGAKMLEQANMPKPVINVVRYHRERHNGSGFPKRVTGEEIPLLAKLAGLVDHYESLIEPRPGTEPLTPAQAVSKLFESRNKSFQEDLVERFIQAVGIYPTGTIVQLNNDRTGVVLSHRPARRLWPKVMVVADAQRRPLKEGEIIDLAQYNENRSHEEALSISGCLPFGVEGVDPSRYSVREPSPSSPGRWSLKRLIGVRTG